MPAAPSQRQSEWNLRELLSCSWKPWPGKSFSIAVDHLREGLRFQLQSTLLFQIHHLPILVVDADSLAGLGSDSVSKHFGSCSLDLRPQTKVFLLKQLSSEPGTTPHLAKGRGLGLF